MKPFYVIDYNINAKKFEKYDIMEYLLDSYDLARPKPKPKDIAEWVKRESMYHWWAKCEHEIILQDWPCGRVTEKWDKYAQIQMNFDLIVEVFKENLKEHKKLIRLAKKSKQL